MLTLPPVPMACGPRVSTLWCRKKKQAQPLAAGLSASVFPHRSVLLHFTHIPFSHLQRALLLEKMEQLVHFFPPHPSLWWDAAIPPPASTHIMVLGLQVDNLVLSEFQTSIFKQCPHELNTWTAPPIACGEEYLIAHWDLNRTREYWDWTCIVSLALLLLPLLNV